MSFIDNFLLKKEEVEVINVHVVSQAKYQIIQNSGF